MLSDVLLGFVIASSGSEVQHLRYFLSFFWLFSLSEMRCGNPGKHSRFVSSYADHIQDSGFLHRGAVSVVRFWPRSCTSGGISSSVLGPFARRLLVWSSLGCAGVLMNAARSQLGFGLHMVCSWLVSAARMAVAGCMSTRSR